MFGFPRTVQSIQSSKVFGSSVPTRIGSRYLFGGLSFAITSVAMPAKAQPAKKSQSTTKVQRAVEIGLADRIDYLENNDQDTDRSLLSLPPRINQKIFESCFRLYKCLIECDQNDVLESGLLMQYVVFNTDEARDFNLSCTRKKNDQVEYARQEGDKIRLVWQYFLRSVNDPKRMNAWTHSSALGRLKLMTVTVKNHTEEGQILTKKPSIEDIVNNMPLPPLGDVFDVDLEDHDLFASDDGSLPAWPPLLLFPAGSGQSSTPLATTPRNSEVIELSDDEGETPAALSGAIKASASGAEPRYNHVQHKKLFVLKRKQNKENKSGEAKSETEKKGATKPDGSAKAPNNPSGRRVRKKTSMCDPALPSDAGGEVEDISVDLDAKQRRFFLEEYEHIATQLFQDKLVKAASICPVVQGNGRDYLSKTVVSFQRNVWHFQVYDTNERAVMGGFTHKQCGGDRMLALMNAMVLLALYDAGASKDHLKLMKATMF